MESCSHGRYVFLVYCKDETQMARAFFRSAVNVHFPISERTGGSVYSTGGAKSTRTKDAPSVRGARQEAIPDHVREVVAFGAKQDPPPTAEIAPE